MRIAGQPLEEYQFILHIAFAIMSGFAFIIQAVYLQKMKIPPVIYVLIVSICICYENSIMSAGNQLQPDSAAIEILYTMQALEIPLLILCLYETAYCLYEEKGASLALVRIEESAPVTCTCSFTCLWFIRVIAGCLFVLNILTNYQLLEEQNYIEAGSGGYIYLSKHPRSLTVWLALIPSIVLSIVALCTSFMVARYGAEYTMSVSYLFKWKMLYVFALGQVISQIFGTNVYHVTTSAGELGLLFGVSYFLYLAQDDLILTAHFADFLHRSNLAFSHVEGDIPDTWSHHHKSRYHKSFDENENNHGENEESGEHGGRAHVKVDASISTNVQVTHWDETGLVESSAGSVEMVVQETAAHDKTVNV